MTEAETFSDDINFEDNQKRLAGRRCPLLSEIWSTKGPSRMKPGGIVFIFLEVEALK